MNLNHLLCLILLTALWIACQPEKKTDQQIVDSTFKPTGTPADLVYNPIRPDGSIDSSFLPIIAWQDTVYQFGTINEGDTISHVYRFTNTGTAPLLINQASSTCGCTIPEWPKTPIPPDSSGTILVKFNSLNKPGAQTKVVTIFANTIPSTNKLTITGNVIPKK